MMTRNDFEILARHLKAMYPEDAEYEAPAGLTENIDGLEEEAYADGYRCAINQVCGACSAVNARFDADAFRAACGFPVSHKKAA